MISYEGINSTDRLYTTAKRKIKTLSKTPSNDELLLLYGLFKQAEQGDNNTSKPWSIDTKAIYKWNAWKEQEGKDNNTAKKEYIEIVELITKKYS
jgi:diazepam-binding inhibitor (GABA receptor modulating acyl-CoA-binding protein)